MARWWNKVVFIVFYCLSLFFGIILFMVFYFVVLLSCVWLSIDGYLFKVYIVLLIATCLLISCRMQVVLLIDTCLKSSVAVSKFVLQIVIIILYITLAYIAVIASSSFKSTPAPMPSRSSSFDRASWSPPSPRPDQLRELEAVWAARFNLDSEPEVEPGYHTPDSTEGASSAEPPGGAAGSAAASSAEPSGGAAAGAALASRPTGWDSKDNVHCNAVPELPAPDGIIRYYAVWNLPGYSHIHGLHAGRGTAAYCGLLRLFPEGRFSTRVAWRRVYSLEQGEQVLEEQRARYGTPRPTPRFWWP